MAANRPVRPSSRHRAGGTDGFAERLTRFEQIFLSNGNNATLAAIEAGYSPKTAHAKGHSLLKKLKETGRLAKVAEKAAERAELKTERTLREVATIAYNDSRRFHQPDGSFKMPEMWDDDMAACVAGVEMGHIVIGKGKRARLQPYVKKIKYWSKIEALDKAMRHAGLFERDNRQRSENLAIQINLVGAPEGRTANGSGTIVQANLVGPNGKNGSHP